MIRGRQLAPWLVSLFILQSQHSHANVLDENFGYTPSSDVTDILVLANDIKHMRAARTDFNFKKQVYTEGSEENTGSITLQALSLESEQRYGQYPLYNIYRGGFDLLGQDIEGDMPGNFDGRPVSNYADTLVNDLFLLNVTNIEAEAALSINVAMAFYGSLYDLLTTCKANGDKAEMNRALDSAVAFWIGADQIKGDSGTGYFFYNLAQFAGEKFNQLDNGEPEAVINKDVVAEFLLLQLDIASDKCASEDGYLEVRVKVKNIVTYLNTVLVQMLLHRIQTAEDGEDTDFVELYSLAILPQIAACQSDLYQSLVQYTITANVDSSTREPLIETLQRGYSCLNINCVRVGAYEDNRIPQCDDESSDNLPAMAGYQPDSDVRGYSRIDRDIRQIRWFMQFGAVQAALEYYQYGWNTDFSLQKLARGEVIDQPGAEFDFFATYYGSAGDTEFANTILMSILEGSGSFTTATLPERLSALDSTLRGLVLYLAITGEFERAIRLVSNADAADAESARLAWDAATAMFVGSTEGPNPGGSAVAPGESLYGLANLVCADFATCNDSGFAVVNDLILGGVIEGKAFLTQSTADQALSVYNEKISANLAIGVIQGMLDGYAAKVQNNEDGSGNAYGYARTVLPLYNGLSANDVATLQAAVDLATSTITPIETFFTAMENILATPNVVQDCHLVGLYTGEDGVARGVCQGVTPDVPASSPLPFTFPPAQDQGGIGAAPTPAPVVTTRGPVEAKPVPPTNEGGLGWGRFAFSDPSTAENDAKVALDVKEMWTSTDSTAAQNAYLSGANFPNGVYGQPTVTSLSAMSTLASNFMSDDIIYNFFRYALYEESLFDTVSADPDRWSYADSVVTLALGPDNGNNPVLGAESSVVMNSWMMIMHQLHDAGANCLTGNSAEALKYLDSAVALWIGEEQAQGKFNSGYLMYSMAQLAISQLGMDEGEAPANTELMDLFNEASDILKQCNSQVDSYSKFRQKMIEISRALSIPLVQQMIYYMSVGDVNFEELFALSVVPQLVGCNEGDYAFLRSQLFEGSFFDANAPNREAILNDLAGGLACLRISCEDLGDTTNANQNLKTLVDQICNDLQVEYDPTFIAGYETSVNVMELARIDLDVHQIDILMRTNSPNAAADVYEYGYNSNAADGLLSLKDMATDPSLVDAGDVYNMFTAFFNGQETFADTYIEAVLQETGAFAAATRAQKAEAVKRMLQGSVIYLQIVSSVEKSLLQCNTTAIASVEATDRAAALFVGSIEGTRNGGSDSNSGTMMMALGKEMCEFFGKCEGGGDATANEFLLFAFSDMKQWFQAGDCDSASAIVHESLYPVLPVALIQGLLYFASEVVPLQANAGEKQRASADAISKAILPQINAIDQDSAATINDNLEYVPNQKQVSEGLPAVFSAVRSVLRGLNVDCDVVGTLLSQSLSVCDETVAPDTDTPTVIADIYQTTTYVQDRANIALDIKQMESDLNTGRKDFAQRVYTEGLNSPIYDKFGIKIGIRSLQQFSTNASATMTNNPLFQTTLYALGDADGQYLGSPVASYADTLVLRAFEVPGTLAAESAVALNVWMEAANELYNALFNCKAQRLTDDDGVHSIDEVAAYWIGDGEVAGNAAEGHLLYNLAERMASKFDTVDQTGQAEVNVKFMRLLNQARLELTFPGACSDDLTTARRLYHIINKITAQMLVVPIQALIDSLLVNDRARVGLYAHATIPLLVGCSDDAFEFLHDRLVNGNYQETQVDALIARLYRVLPCLGITCEDVGNHLEDTTTAVCESSEDLAPLSGYRPTKSVQEYAQIDLDIKQIDVLMAVGAMEVARDIYRFGRHASTGSDDGRTSLSLENLATSTSRVNVPEYSQFTQYFDNDNNYADSMMQRAFDLSQDYPLPRRRHLIVGISRYIILYMAALEAMWESIKACEAENQVRDSMLAWDKAVAFIIGSKEGNGNSGTQEGLLIWGLAKENCAQFGLCTNLITGSSEINERLRTLFYAGRAEASAGGCAALRKSTNEVSALIRAPLVQGLLSSIIKIGEIPEFGPVLDQAHTEGYIFAHSILPLVASGSRGSAETLSSNLDFEGPPLLDGVDVVAETVTSSLDAMDLTCADVGSTGSIDTCTGEVSSSNGPSLPLFLGVGAGVFVGAVLGIILLVAQSQRQKKREAERPKFIPNSRGESNFDSDRGAAATDSFTHSDATPADDFLGTALPDPV